MEFIDLKAQYARLEPAVRAHIDAVLAHGHFIMGPEVARLEERLAAYAGARHCISCASGTDALLMPLMAWNVGPGDAVFVPAFSFFATAEVPALLGATPIFVDIDPVTYNISPAALAQAIQAVRSQDSALHPLPPQALAEIPLRPRCIIPVDLFGQAAAYEDILPLAAAEGLLVLEDAAQAFGGIWQGKKTCALGCTVAATSFFPAKPLGCYGDGGALFTDDDTLADTLKSLRIHGKGHDKYDNIRVGINGRLDTLQAAVLLPKLEIFEEECCRRQDVARWYAAHLEGLAPLTLPTVLPQNRSAFAQYTLRVPTTLRQGRDGLAAHLRSKNIPANIYYPKPLHTQGAFASLLHQDQDMPVAAQCCHEVLSLPFHPYMTEETVATVCGAVRQYCKS